MKKVTSILYYLFFFFSSFIFFTFALITWILTLYDYKNFFLLHLYTQLWESFLFSINPNWKITVEGKNKINNSEPVVFVSNHQSEFDIIVVSKLYARFKWVSKAEVFKTPIIGWNMRMNRYIELKRGDRKSILQMIKDCISALKNNNSVFIFPEGTRSKTGVLKSFSSGAFVIAKRAKVDIQPIAISGTKDIMVKGSWMLNFKANVTLKVLDKIPYEIFKDMESSDIAKMVREQIAAEVKEHQFKR
jgi:1-acyl-sn-glycerol-3-phosphate acyltransferase